MATKTPKSGRKLSRALVSKRVVMSVFVCVYCSPTMVVGITPTNVVSTRAKGDGEREGERKGEREAGTVGHSKEAKKARVSCS